MSKLTSLRVLFSRTLALFGKRVFVAFTALKRVFVHHVAKVAILVLILTPVITTVYSITRAGTSANNTAYAVSPATLNFQARLLNSSGSLVPDGVYNVEFKIYNASTGGSPLWTETRLTTDPSAQQIVVKNGYLSVYLGDKTALPTNIWNQQLWLTMNIGGTSGTPSWDGEMTPRIRLTSVPFAFRATVADSAETLSKNTGSFTGTVDFANMTADRKYIFPDTSLATTASPGTICVYNGAASNCPAASGSAYYLQNDTVLQTQTNFHIQARDSGVNGTIGGVITGAANGQTVDLLQFRASDDTTVLASVTAGGNLRVASSVDTYAAGTLSVGTSNATAITLGKSGITTTIAGAMTVNEAATFNDNITVAAQKTITMVGGTTAQRPASPTEGMVYFDTDTKQLLVYANGKWQGDRSTATKIVAASNSSQAVKDAADYVASGTADQNTINAALTAAAGGKVYLAEGTYTVNGSILVPSSTTLTGSRTGTLITIPNGFNSNINIIANSNNGLAAGNHDIVLSNLKIDGNASNVTNSQTGIGVYANWSGTSAMSNVTVENVTLQNIRGGGIYSEAQNSTFSNNLFDNTNRGLDVESIVTSNTVTNNVFINNSANAVIFYGVSNSVIAGNAFRNNGTSIDVEGDVTHDALRNVITGNSIQTSTGNAVFIGTSSYNTITSNTIYDSGNSTANDAIYIESSNSNIIDGNNISDASATTTNYAINISSSASNTNYLSNNLLNGSSINDAGTGTVYGGQLNSSNNYVIQPAGTVELVANTNVTGSLSVSGTTTTRGLVVNTATATDDQILVSVATGGAARFNGTITNADLTAARTWTLPDESGTFCMQGSTSCGFAATTGGTGYIQNQNASQQATSNFWISGTGRADTSILTPLLDTASAAVLNIGTTNATQINLNKNVVVAASQSLTITGGNTASRPASPTEGMLYFDTSTKQLLIYANGKWQADRSSSTKIVGTSASGGASSAVASVSPDSADYVNTSTTSAQTVINSALSSMPATGGTVYLMEGTYIVDGSINIPNNVTLAGAGYGTIIKVANGVSATLNIITNSDQTTGTNVSVTNLSVDGNSTNVTGTQNGIGMVGIGSTASARSGARVINTWVRNFTSYGIGFASTANNIISGNSLANNSSAGIFMQNTTNTTITGNVARNNVIGLSFIGGSANSINNNVISLNTSGGIVLNGSNYNNINANQFVDNGGSTTNNAIYLTAADNNTVSNNTITDSSATTNNYAINVFNATSDNNQLTGNNIGGGTINDAGTGTVYGGQINGSGNYVIQPAGTVELMKNTNVTGNLSVSGTTTTRGLTVNTATATDDQILVSVTAGGAGRFNGTITNADLTAARTYTLPDASGTFAVSAAGNIALSSAGNITLTGQVPIANGGTGANTSQAAINALSQLTTTGDLLFYDGTNSTRFARGSNGQCLTSNATTLVWASCVGTEADTLASVTGRGATTTTASSFNGGASIRGLTVDTATATDDRILINITAGGAGRFDGSITNADLTAARTWTLPDASGTFITTGNLTAINQVGTITAGTWNGTAITDAYIDDAITISSAGSVDWTALTGYPAACAAGSAITQLGDTVTCSAFATGTAASYIQNQNASQQATSNYWISGSGRADTSFLTPSLDVASAGTLSIGTGTATAVSISKSGVTTTINGALSVAQASTFNGTLTFSGVAPDITTGTNEDLTIDANGSGITRINDSTTIGASAGSGTTFTNNGSTVASTLALTNFATGGSIGTAAATVDIYTSVSVAQTTAGQSLTLPTPTASTVYGRILYLSNIGTSSFGLLNSNLNPGATATLMWAHTNGGDSWVFAGADGTSINNQKAAGQNGDFWIQAGGSSTGIGRADGGLQAPSLDTATGVALNIGATNATAINLNQNTTIASGKSLAVTSGTTTLTGSTAGPSSPVYVGGGSTRGFTNSIVINKPAGTTTGDLALVFIAVNAGQTVTPPSGWTATTSDVSTGGAFNVNGYWFYKTMGTTEGSSWTFSVSTTANTSSTLIVYRNVTLGNSAVSHTTGDVSSFNTPTLTSSANSVIVSSWVNIASVGNGGLPTISNLITDRTGTVSGSDNWSRSVAGDETQVSAGTTTARTTTYSGSTASVVARAIELKALTVGPTALVVSNSTSTGNIFVANDDATAVFTIANEGAVILQNSTDSASAFAVKRLNGNNVLTVDTSNGRIGINSSTASADLTFGEGASRTINVLTRTSNAAGNNLAISAGAAGSGASAFGGGILTLQGGAAGGTGNANGGGVTIAGGAGVGTGAQGLVALSTSAFTSLGPLSFGADTNVNSLSAGAVDLYSSITASATVSGKTLTINAPTITTVGRLLYVANVGSNDFNILLAGTSVSISLKPNTTATLIWNGTGWTAAGASSSTDLQAAYNNTLTSAGGAELVLNAPGGAADGLTIRNNATTPIVGGLLEVQTSVGSNIVSVNNNATEYAANGGSETAGGTTTTFPASTWTASPTGGTQATISRTITTGEFATGIAAAKVVTTGATTANQGIADQIAVNGTNTALTANLTYTVSFTVKTTSNFNTLDVVYSKDGTNTATTACKTGATATESIWSRVSCTFTAPSSGITTSNAIFIRQSNSNSAARTFYIDNLSVNVNANTNLAADGSADSAANIGAGTLNWGSVNTATVAQSTSTLYDTAGSVSVTTSATAGRGVYNKLSNNIVPSNSTQYRVSFFAKGNNTANLSVAYTPDNGTTNIACQDYNAQAINSTSWTLISCYFTTTTASVTNAQVRITQASGAATTFFVDALNVNLNNNNANNVQIGGANLGGPTTLLTLDRSSTAPIAANNDAYLGSMYYDTTTGRIQCYEADGWGACGSSPDNIITLTPEYPGAVLGGPGNVMGGGAQTPGIGVMTSEFCSSETGILVVGTLCANHEARNYYHWTSPQTSQQIYSIYVVYKLPTTFKSFNDSNTIKLTSYTDSLTNGIATLQVFRKNAAGTSITACGTTAQTINTSTGTWQQTPYDAADETTCGFAGGDNIIFKIDMKSQSNGNVYVENLDFVYTNN